MIARLQRTPGLARGLTACVLALFALGWLADRAHVAFEAHAYCAEHQRVEHVDGSAAAVDHGHATGHPDRAPSRGPAIDAHEEASSAHAACCVLLGRGADPVALPCAFASIDWTPIAETNLPAIAWGTSPRGSIPLLALAPKQSPPAA